METAKSKYPVIDLDEKGNPVCVHMQMSEIETLMAKAYKEKANQIAKEMRTKGCDN